MKPLCIVLLVLVAVPCFGADLAGNWVVRDPLPDGTFRPSLERAFQLDSLSEDVDAVFFDANGDGRPDLYVVSGGNEFEKADAALQDRLYVNDGHGGFHRDSLALPRLSESGSCVVPGDWNGDGHLDLFVGRRVVAADSPNPGRSRAMT